MENRLTFLKSNSKSRVEQEVVTILLYLSKQLSVVPHKNKLSRIYGETIQPLCHTHPRSLSGNECTFGTGFKVAPWWSMGHAMQGIKLGQNPGHQRRGLVKERLSCI